jgi:hypothetical protein
VIEVADFSNTAATPTVISSILGIGSNAVSGTLPGVSSIPDVDVFQVNNPGELGIAGITISFPSFIAGSPSRPAMVNLLAPNGGTLTANGSGSFLLPAIINNASTLIFELVGPGQRGSEFITAGSADYVVTISTVPEPSVFLFLAGAALSFLVLPRQKPAPPYSPIPSPGSTSP